MDQATLREIEQCREELHQIIDLRFNDLILQMGGRDISLYLEDEGMLAVPFISAPHECKGMKPAAVILPDGSMVETSTWKKAALAILRDCDADPGCHQRLCELRGRTFGNFRSLLSESPEGMGAALKISDGLYLESKFDTEALLNNLTQKILDQVEYDYSGIVILYRDPQCEMVREHESQGPVLSM